MTTSLGIDLNNFIIIRNQNRTVDPLETGEDIFIGAIVTRGEICQEKKHPMDSKYPHECFNSKDANSFHNFHNTIDWKSFLEVNGIPHLRSTCAYPLHLKSWYIYFEKYKYLKKLWKNPIVKFYCCNCFKMMR